MLFRSFSREANVGIRGKYGQLSFGRQYTPHFLVFAMYDPTELSLGSSDSPYFFPGPAAVTGWDGGLVRADNSIQYVLPTSFGLTNFFYVALGEHQNAAEHKTPISSAIFTTTLPSMTTAISPSWAAICTATLRWARQRTLLITST